MKLTIIADDRMVGIDGVFLCPLDLSLLDPSVHAVQWNENVGEVEYKTRFEDGVFVKQVNTRIHDMTPYAFAVDAWHAASAELALAEAAHQLPITEL